MRDVSHRIERFLKTKSATPATAAGLSATAVWLLWKATGDFFCLLLTLQPLRFDIRRKLTARSDRVKSVDLHPTEPWMVVSLYSGTMAVWNHETQVSISVPNIPPNTFLTAHHPDDACTPSCV